MRQGNSTVWQGNNTVWQGNNTVIMANGQIWSHRRLLVTRGQTILHWTTLHCTALHCTAPNNTICNVTIAPGLSGHPWTGGDQMTGGQRGKTSELFTQAMQRMYVNFWLLWRASAFG